MLLTLTLALLAGPTSCLKDYYQAEDHPAVKARLEEFSKGLTLRIASDNQPYQDTDGTEEPVCPNKIFSCRYVYLYTRNRMLKATNVSFRAKSFLDADLDTPYSKADDKFPARVITTKSTAVTDSTTKGWKVAFKLTAGGPPQNGGEIGGEYGEQYTAGTTTVRQVTHEVPCPAGNRCTIQTLTYHARVIGTCRVEPIIDCGGAADACLGFRKTWDHGRSDYAGYAGRIGFVGSAPPPRRVYEWEKGPCSQFVHFSQRHCSRGRYKTEPCEVYAPILDPSGKPRTSVVLTRQKISWGDSADNKARAEELPELVFLED